MKKLLLTLLSASLLLVFSCKKDSKGVLSSSKVNVKKYAVKFGVSSFTQTVGNVSVKSSNSRLMSLNKSLADSSLSNAVPFFYYLVYDAAGNEVNRIWEDASSPGTGTRLLFIPNNNAPGGYDRNYLVYNYIGQYGNVQDSLSSGTYTVVVFGSTKDNLLINTNGFGDFGTSPLALNNAYAMVGHRIDPSPQSGDVFYKNITITVGNQNVSQNIQLDRIVGQVTVNIEDALPANAAYYELAMIGEKTGFFLANTRPAGQETGDNSEDYTINSTDIGKTNFKITQFVLNTTAPLTFEITVYDSKFVVLGSATIPGVQINKNQRTILSGSLFKKASQFTITANQAWDPNVTTIHF